MPTENLYTPNCMRTVTGRYVNVREPDPTTIDIYDIAWGLSGEQRFGNQLPVSFTVAEHSMLVCNHVPMELKLQALMHDASDFLFRDMAAPIKQDCHDYKRLETRMMHVIAEKYGFAWPMDPIVKEADLRVRQFEWDEIMLRPDDPQGITDVPRREVCAAFLRMFHDLTAYRWAPNKGTQLDDITR